MGRITGTVTQGGADAFAQAEIQTALEGQTSNAFQVTSIQYEFDTTHILAGANNCDVELAISRRTKSAMPDVTDTDLIYKWHWGSAAATSVGQFVQPLMAGEWRPPEQTLIVEDPLFLDIDSTATGLTLTALVVINFDIVSISSLDRLTLLTLSL